MAQVNLLVLNLNLQDVEKKQAQVQSDESIQNKFTVLQLETTGGTEDADLHLITQEKSGEWD